MATNEDLYIFRSQITALKRRRKKHGLSSVNIRMPRRVTAGAGRAITDARKVATVNRSTWMISP